MSNPILNHLRRRARETLELWNDAAKSVTGTSEVTGAVREAVVQHMLAPFLPQWVEFGTGAVVDATSTRAMPHQYDWILLDRDLTLRGYATVGANIYPIEAVLGFIEVVSILDDAAFERIVSRLEALHALKYRWATRPGADERSIPFGVIVTRECTASVLERVATEISRKSFLVAVCVLGQECRVQIDSLRAMADLGLLTGREPGRVTAEETFNDVRVLLKLIHNQCWQRHESLRGWGAQHGVSDYFVMP